MRIELKNISISFNSKAILNNYSKVFESDKSYVVMGESGIGKTTLLRLILGLTKPDSGEIVIDDINSFGVVFQEDRLIEDLSPVNNIKITSPNISTNDIKKELKKLLPEDAIDKKVKELSGGMKRRVATVRALITDADCYVLDEPLTGLDNDNKELVTEYIKAKSQGKLLIVASHDNHFANFCNEIKLG